MKGTGLWAHDSSKPINYNLLLNRFFTLLHSQHPDLASSGSKSYKIPPPQCLREGNKKVSTSVCSSPEYHTNSMFSRPSLPISQKSARE